VTSGSIPSSCQSAERAECVEEKFQEQRRVGRLLVAAGEERHQYVRNGA
jgi:hypothetical protein